MINLRHRLAAKFELTARPGQFIEAQDKRGVATARVSAERSSAVQPETPIRLMASLLYLKHSFSLSNYDVRKRPSASPQPRFSSGRSCYEHRQPCDAKQIGRFGHRIGEDGMEQSLKATIGAAVAMKTVTPQALQSVTVDIRLLAIARRKVVNAAKRRGISLKQTFATECNECKELRRKAGGYARAKQFRRLKRAVKYQRTILGIVMRKVQSKLNAPSFAATNAKALSELTMWPRAHPAGAHAAALRQEQTVRAACIGDRHWQGASYASRTSPRRQGRSGDLAPHRADGRRAASQAIRVTAKASAPSRRRPPTYCRTCR